MAITFTVVTDKNIAAPPSIRTFVGGHRARETWMADSSQEREVVVAPEFPKIGDPFDAVLFPNVKLIEADTRYWVGKDSIDKTKRGRVLVDLVWETPGLNGALPPPIPGSRFTTMTPSSVSQTVYGAVNPDGSPVLPSVSIGNGSGVEKVFGVFTFEVHRYEDKETFNPNSLMQQMNFLQADGRLNASSLLLPPLLGSGDDILLSPGQARYVSGRMDDNQGVVEIIHEIAVGLDHTAYWGVEDKDGNLIATGIARIYPDGTAQDWAGLW